MSPALGGAGRANFALRVALLSLAAVVVGCSANPASAALKVEVILEAGLISRCVKVTATDGVLSRETKAIPLAGKSSPLTVGVTADGMTQPVSLQALGYSDEACTTRAPGEESEKKEGSFTNPPSTVTLTLRPAANGDGGTDGGTDGGNDGGTDAGVDGGVDAGIDLDMDGVPLPDDCDDTDPLIHPGATESCNDGIDNNCDNQTDCQANGCSMMGCMGGGTCMGNVCVALTESVCNDGVDNNNNGLVDCADPDCPVNQICSDNNACTTGDRCVVNPDGGAGICQKVGDFACMTPPAAQCWAMTGTCVADGGATCVYTQMAGSCNDGLGCTDSDTCSNGTCSGTPKTCPTPTNSCLSAVGTCQEPSGTCFNAPLMAGTGTCSDNNNCTTMDRCDGDGGCTGTAVTCAPPTQCQNASTSCDTGGNCLYAPRTGQACDAGTGAGTCDGTATCNANPVTLFPTPPSNFTESQLPADGGTTGINVTCNTTLNTGGTPAITMGACVTMPAHVVLTSQTMASESTLLIRVPSLTIAMGQTLTIEGNRPVIFAVTGNVSINGTIRLNNPGAPAACGDGVNGTSKCGAGGGGFGTAGTTGGTSDQGTAGGGGAANGSAALTPLRGGCSGGNGAGTGGVGGTGGGSIQIVASGTITISNSGVIAAPGEGATAPTGNDVGGGGGGSGGAILLEAPTITMTGNPKLTANGGSGSSGANGNTDGTAGKTGNTTSAAVVTGGAATDTGTGGSGGAGTTAPTVGGNDPDDGAGGGGGAVGRIRLNATTCTGGSGAVISPPHTGNTCT
jgi:hypothetical protein